MDFDRVLAQDGAIASVRDRLRALDGADVFVTIVRGETRIVRSGRFVLERATVRVVDAPGHAIATLLPRDAMEPEGDGVQFVLRPAFRVICTREAPPLPPPDGDERFAFISATRAVAAELEAGFRSALLFRPDPDPDASLRARHGVPPIEEAPLRDGSVRFAVGHASATLRPDDPTTVRLTCSITTVRGVRQTVTPAGPREGTTYGFGSAEVERLAADMRAFLAGDASR